MRIGPGWALLAFVCGLEFVDLSLISAVSPLLPSYAEDFGFGRSTSGQIVAAFAVGSSLGAIPAAMLCGRYGTKAITIAGLLGIAGGSVWLGLADSTLELAAARFTQGIASATAWGAGITWLSAATPPERRGRTLGISGAFAIMGTLAGPGLGALAASVGIAPVFATFAGLVLALTLLGAVLPGVSATRQNVGALIACLRSPTILAGFWLILLAGGFLAVQASLGPLRLDALGFGAGAIGVVYMIGAVAEAGASPLYGHLLDRRSRLGPVLWVVAVAAILAAVLALPGIDDRWLYAGLIAASSTAYGLFFLPGLKSLADGADAIGLDHALAFSLATLAWAPGQTVGALVGGTLAEAAGDSAAFGLAAFVTAVTLVAMGALRARRPGAES